MRTTRLRGILRRARGALLCFLPTVVIGTASSALAQDDLPLPGDPSASAGAQPPTESALPGAPGAVREAGDRPGPVSEAPPPGTAPMAVTMTPPPAPERPRTLISGPVEHGAFGAATVSYAPIAGEDALLFGARGGWIVNHCFVLGGGFHGLVNQMRPPAGSTGRADRRRLRLGYAGVLLEYIVAPMSMVHGSLSVLVGGGGVSDADADVGPQNEMDRFVVAEPVATVEVNVTDFMRLAVEARYRVVGFVDMPGLENRDLRGWSGGLTAKFGRF